MQKQNLFLDSRLECKSLVRLLVLFSVSAILILACYGCAAQPEAFFKKPQSLRPAATEEVTTATMLESVNDGKPPSATTFSKPPNPPTPGVSFLLPQEPKIPLAAGPPMTLNVDSMPLPAFINEVFGTILGLSFEISPNLQKMRDLVTLRITQPVKPLELYRVALKVLGNYGVGVEKDGDLYRFLPSSGGSVDPPLLVSGRTLPDVPVSHRSIFQVVPLNVINNVQATLWLRKIFKGQPLEIADDPSLNAIILSGAPDLVSMGLEAVRIVDQPTLRGQHSLRIEPAFQSPIALADNLVKVLKSEGYAASSLPEQGSITIMPLDSVNSVLAFAIDETVLEHVRKWAGELDRPTPSSDGQGLYYYGVKNTRAISLADVLNQLVGGPALQPAGDGLENTQAKVKSNNLRKPSTLGRSLVVDEIRNGLIFQGPPETWGRLLPIIQQMDVPSKQVLIEVLVAEITLSEQEEFGVEWLVQNLDISGADAIFGTLGGLGIGSSGLSFTLENAGNFKALLNAFAANDRVSILSTPRVLVKSGAEATLDVGSDVPLVTSQGTAADLVDNGTSSILQEIQYRKTGVLLQVKPVVHAGRRVDIEVTQEVSKAEPNTTSDISSPSILLRRVNTSLSLRDGGSVLLGGLISRDTSAGHSGIPILMDIPWLGQLFRVDKSNATRTELIVMISPYIITSYEEAEALTENYRSMLTK